MTDALNEPRDAIGHDVGKATPKEAIFSAGEPGDATGHDVGKPTPSVATPSSKYY
jgi:hypothetical protein